MALKRNDDFRERPHQLPQFELVGPDGRAHGPYASRKKAIDEAFWKWPGIEQDEDETGAGWNIRLVGAAR